jgi:hypothetical protein
MAGEVIKLKNQEPGTRNQKLLMLPGFSVLGSRFLGLGWLRERTLWGVLLAGLFAWTLAYQWPYAFHLAIGGDPATHSREDDRPFLQPPGQPYRENASFNASQPQPPRGDSTNWWELPEEPYRWTTASAIMAFPGIGGGPWLVEVRASGQPMDQPTQSRWSDSMTTQEVAIAPGPARVYRFLARPDQFGDLTLQFQTEPYAAPNDPRSLGFRMHGITLRPAGFQWPSWAQLGWLLGCVGLCYGSARRLGVGQRRAGAGMLALALALALLLAAWRMWLTIFTPALLALLAGCYVLAAVLLQMAQRRWTNDERRTTGATVKRRAESGEQRAPVARSCARPLMRSCVHHVILSQRVVALIVLAFALRMGGMLHPHTIFSDIGLNSNNILELTVGNVYFTEGLPANAGGGQAPYPPGQYLVLAPGQLLVPVNDEGRRLLVKLGSALLDSLIVGLLWLMLRRAGAGEGAALFGAALYIAPTPLLGSFSVGEFANIFGQGLAMPILVLLSVGGLGDVQSPRRGVSTGGRWAFGMALLGMALLGHLGVTISLAAMLTSLAALWLLAPSARRSFAPLVVVGVIAAAFVGLFYYSAFAQLLAERFAGTAEGMTNVPRTLSLVDKLLHQERLLVISPLLLGLGALGALLPRRSSRGMWLRLALGAWWLGTLLGFGLLLFANQAVRWQHFLYPALCLGGGLLLAALWRRGHAARLVVLVTLLFIVGQSVALWFERLANAYH